MRIVIHINLRYCINIRYFLLYNRINHFLVSIIFFLLVFPFYAVVIFIVRNLKVLKDAWKFLRHHISKCWLLTLNKFHESRKRRSIHTRNVLVLTLFIIFIVELNRKWVFWNKIIEENWTGIFKKKLTKIQFFVLFRF